MSTTRSTHPGTTTATPSRADRAPAATRADRAPAATRADRALAGTVTTDRAPAAAIPGDRALVAVALGVTAVSLTGALVAVGTGLSGTWADAVGSAARLSVPLPMNVVLLVLAVLAAGARRRLALPAAVLLALACTIAVVSGAFDGGYAARLAPGERLCQVGLVVALLALAVLAACRALRLRSWSGASRRTARP